MWGRLKERAISVRHGAARAWRTATEHRKRLVAASLLALVALFATATVTAYAYDRVASDKILPGVHVAGVDLSGLTRDKARHALRRRAHELLGRKIAVHAADHVWRVTPRKLGGRVNVGAAVGHAFAVSQSLPWMARIYHRLAGWSVDRNLRLPVHLSKARVRAFVSHVTDSVDRHTLNALIKGVGSKLVKQHAQVGREVKTHLSFRRLLGAVKTGRPAVRFRVIKEAPKVTDRELGETLTVDLTTNTLRLWDGFRVKRTYPIATAQPGFSTPPGRWKIVDKLMWPSWTNPDPTGWGAGMPLYIPPGPSNPLGTRALYLSAPGIRIHGTPESSSIGTYASHGCIRMYISDSEALYPLVSVGMPVVIFGAPPWGTTASTGPAG